ncbi:MAG TPA: HlyD family efflux transporter periplasmic adaptor subunit, partial [Tepidisphaeraceae bacterium]
VPAVEGQRVKAGDLLVELAPYDLLERRAQAKAELAQLEARLMELKHGPRQQEIAAGEARLRFANAELDLAQATYNRIKPSFEKNAVSAEEMDRAEKELKAATANLGQRQAEVDLLKAGTRPEQVAQAEASVQAAQAFLTQTEKQIEELTVKAPAEAIIESLDLQPGDIVAPNAPVLSLTALGNLWVRAYVPENHLNLQNGQKLMVAVDSFPGRTFAGHVSFVSRQAEFTPNNVQTPEERSKQVFRVKITLDEGQDVLRPGMSADVKLE